MEEIFLFFCNELKKLIFNKNKNALSQMKGKEKTSVKNDNNTIKKDLLIKNQNFIEEKSHILNQKEEGKRNNLLSKINLSKVILAEIGLAGRKFFIIYSTKLI